MAPLLSTILSDEGAEDRSAFGGSVGLSAEAGAVVCPRPEVGRTWYNRAFEDSAPATRKRYDLHLLEDIRRSFARALALGILAAAKEVTAPAAA